MAAAVVVLNITAADAVAAADAISSGSSFFSAAVAAEAASAANLHKRLRFRAQPFSLT